MCTRIRSRAQSAVPRGGAIHVDQDVLDDPGIERRHAPVDDQRIDRLLRQGEGGRGLHAPTVASTVGTTQGRRSRNDGPDADGPGTVTRSTRPRRTAPPKRTGCAGTAPTTSRARRCGFASRSCSSTCATPSTSSRPDVRCGCSASVRVAAPTSSGCSRTIPVERRCRPGSWSSSPSSRRGRPGTRPTRDWTAWRSCTGTRPTARRERRGAGEPAPGLWDLRQREPRGHPPLRGVRAGALPRRRQR